MDKIKRPRMGLYIIQIQKPCSGTQTGTTEVFVYKLFCSCDFVLINIGRVSQYSKIDFPYIWRDTVLYWFS